MIKSRIRQDKKIAIIVSSVLGIIILMLVIFLLAKGSGRKIITEQEKLKNASENVSISFDNVESYRAKVRLSSKKDSKLNQNYIVYNYNNEKYDITLFDETESKNYSVKKGQKNKNLDYDYTNTDLFLEGLEKAKNINTENQIISDEKYTIYTFNIDSDVINNILKPFDISTDLSAKGTVYVDSNDKVYLIIYDNDDIYISVSYTRINQINK